MSWLSSLTTEEILNGKFPLSQVLHNSFYYPSCGFDGGIVKDCNTIARDLDIQSFVYCDYAAGEQAFNIQQNTFLGYQVLASRKIVQSELIPNGWAPTLPPHFSLQSYQRFKEDWKPFLTWTVYDRVETRDENHGPKRFSLLYLGGEGVATYQALYWANRMVPRAFAIIQPGSGFGINWTDFMDPNGPFAWVVNHNPAGAPNIVYYGGYTDGYDDFSWDGFARKRIIHSYYGDSGEVGIWEK